MLSGRHHPPSHIHPYTHTNTHLSNVPPLSAPVPILSRTGCMVQLISAQGLANRASWQGLHRQSGGRFALGGGVGGVAEGWQGRSKTGGWEECGGWGGWGSSLVLSYTHTPAYKHTLVHSHTRSRRTVWSDRSRTEMICKSDVCKLRTASSLPAASNNNAPSWWMDVNVEEAAGRRGWGGWRQREGTPWESGAGLTMRGFDPWLLPRSIIRSHQLILVNGQRQRPPPIPSLSLSNTHVHTDTSPANAAESTRDDLSSFFFYYQPFSNSRSLQRTTALFRLMPHFTT